MNPEAPLDVLVGGSISGLSGQFLVATGDGSLFSAVPAISLGLLMSVHSYQKLEVNMLFVPSSFTEFAMKSFHLIVFTLEVEEIANP